MKLQCVTHDQRVHSTKRELELCRFVKNHNADDIDKTFN